MFCVLKVCFVFVSDQFTSSFLYEACWTFHVVQATLTKFDVPAGNMKFNTSVYDLVTKIYLW
jgi:hypothetical protein